MTRRGAGLIKQFLKTQDRATALYRQAGQMLDQLVEKLDAGDVVDLGDGRVARLVDQYAGRNTCFKSSAFPRYKVEVETRG